MAVVSRKSVRACVERALLLDRRDVSDEQRLDDAIAATAQALHVPDEEVRACVPQEQPA
jgi:hypothetical protein